MEKSTQGDWQPKKIKMSISSEEEDCVTKMEETDPDLPCFTEVIVEKTEIIQVGVGDPHSSRRDNVKPAIETSKDAKVVNFPSARRISVKPGTSEEVKANEPEENKHSFYWFAKDETIKIENEHPEYNRGKILMELGRRWRTANDQVRTKYEVMADRDKVRYVRELAAYKQKMAEDDNSNK